MLFCCFSLLGLSGNIPRDQILSLASSIFDLVYKIKVRVIFKQRNANPSDALVMLTESSRVEHYINQLKSDGYELGNYLYEYIRGNSKLFVKQILSRSFLRNNVLDLKHSKWKFSWSYNLIVYNSFVLL